MRAVSNVVAAIILIGITIAGFAIAYPILFSEAKGFSGIGALMGLEAHSKAVRLVLIDYSVSHENGYYTVTLWLYNAGWEEAHITKIGVPQALYPVSITIEPGGTREAVFRVPDKYGEPDKVVVVTEANVFSFNLD
ncbi:MAG: hypothetical protein GXO43_00760 [Crenarchaeota archaeon]|nr:hypothetical protein [Thermoproteota archaeon]